MVPEILEVSVRTRSYGCNLRLSQVSAKYRSLHRVVEEIPDKLKF
jgi:hypothetical protein